MSRNLMSFAMNSRRRLHQELIYILRSASSNSESMDGNSWQYLLVRPDNKNSLKNLCKPLFVPESGLNVYLETVELNVVFEHVKTFRILVEKLPLLDLLSLAQHFSWNGHTEGLSLVRDALIRSHPFECCKQVYLCHYFAQLKWINNNVKVGSEELNQLYIAHPQIRETIIGMIKALIEKTVAGEGNAVTTVVTDFAVEFYRRHKIHSVFRTLWQSLFLSEWKVDQTKCVDLLEENPDLRELAKCLFPLISSDLLKSHQLDDYHRLIEISLKFDMNDVVATLLRALFDHYYSKGYSRGCSAVFDCANALNIELTRDQLFKYTIINNSTLPRTSGTANNHFVPPQLKF